MKNSYLAFAIITILSMAFSGCGGGGECPPDCSDGNPCTSDRCGEETGYQCQSTPIPGCSLDCPQPCTGTVGQYMQTVCDPFAKQCATDEKIGISKSISTATNEARVAGGSTIKVTTTYKQPFNMGKDIFNIVVYPTVLSSSVSNFRINSIELTAMDSTRQTVTLGRITPERYLWSTDSEIDEDMIIDFPTTADDGSFTSPILTISFEYDIKSGSQTVHKSESYKITLKVKSFEWLNPTMTYECPDSCDDRNPGTLDRCNAETGNFCEHVPIPRKCGNYECDGSETKCTCPEDCGPCSGDAGTYLEYTCSGDSCITTLKSGVSKQPVTLTDDRNINIFYLQNTFTYNNPFDVNSDTFDAEFSLYSKQDTVSNIKIKEVRLMESSTQIASDKSSETLGSIGSTAEYSLPVLSFMGNEELKTLSVKVFVEYTYAGASGPEIRNIEFTKGLGKVTLIRPSSR